MSKPVYRLSSISLRPEGKVTASLFQGDKLIEMGFIEVVLMHAKAQGFVVENVQVEAMPPNACLPEGLVDAP